MSRPSMMRSLLFTGSRGARMGLSTGAVSVPLGVYCARTVPPGVKTATKRWAGVPAPYAGPSGSMISSHGNAMAMLPAPRMTARRFKRNLAMALTPWSRTAGVVEELVGLGQREQELLHVVA